MRLAPLRSTCVYLNINSRYDRPKISHELQVNVPRTIGILCNDVNDISVSKRLNCLLYLFARNSKPRLKAAIDREPWFTGTIEHRFSNSVYQSERA